MYKLYVYMNLVARVLMMIPKRLSELDEYDDTIENAATR